MIRNDAGRRVFAYGFSLEFFVCKSNINMIQEANAQLEQNYAGFIWTYLALDIDFLLQVR